MITKRQKRPKHPSTHKQVDKTWYIHTPCYSAIKRNHVLIAPYVDEPGKYYTSEKKEANRKRPHTA